MPPRPTVTAAARIVMQNHNPNGQPEDVYRTTKTLSNGNSNAWDDTKAKGGKVHLKRKLIAQTHTHRAVVLLYDKPVFA